MSVQLFPPSVEMSIPEVPQAMSLLFVMKATQLLYPWGGVVGLLKEDGTINL